MESLARWSTTHRKRVVAGWIVLLVLSLGAASRLKNHFDNNLTLPNTGAQHASDLLHSRFPAIAGDSDQIVFQTTHGKLTDPANRAHVERTLAAVSRLPHVASVADPFRSAATLSRDKTIAFATLTFDERGDVLPASATNTVIHAAQAMAGPSFQVELGGYAIEEAHKPTLGAATLIGIAAAMVILFLSFGSLLAMALPILCALFGLGTSMGLIAGLTHVLSTPDFATELALLIGLGVGIDYALFVVTRFRDAYRETTGDVGAAVAVSMNTAGRSIAFAGATVIIAVLGLFIVGVHIFYGVALAISISVLLVLAASLTLLPALLAMSGQRIGRKAPQSDSSRGMWVRWIAAIQRRPAVAAAASTAFLLLLAAPTLGLRLAASDASNDLSSTTTHKAYVMLTRGFGPGFNGPLQLAVQLPAGDAEKGIAELRKAVAATPGVASVGPPIFNTTHDTAAIQVFPATAPQSKETYSLVKHLRSNVIPPAARSGHFTAFVGGATAAQVDLAHVLSTKLPYFIAAVILLSALLLLVVFRSLLVPLQAAIMNLLSFAAAFGVVQAIFERGWGAGVLGVARSPIESFIPVIVFAIVFGLSMDYEVFLVSRIHEEWSHGASHSDAVRRGLSRTSRVVTAAAAVMVVVFSSFAASDNHLLKLLGLSLAVAVFLDAVVIRSILLPAVFQLFGKRTWAFPAWADRRLPRLAIEPPEQKPDGPNVIPLPTEAG
jgi:putative drug exporter of the RND superfamily